MKIREFKKIVINDATWEDVVLALTPEAEHLAPGYSAAPENWKELVSEMGLCPDEVLLSATHSLSTREVEFLNGTPTFFLKDKNFADHGWHIITKENLCCALWDNGEERIKIYSMQDGSFQITGRFPVENGEAFDGNYHYTMMNPCRHETARKQFEEIQSHRAANFDCAIIELLDDTDICQMDGFQEWESGPVDPAPFVDLVKDLDELVHSEQEITVDSNKVKALVLSPKDGWDDRYEHDRNALLQENPGLVLPELKPLTWGICVVA